MPVVFLQVLAGLLVIPVLQSVQIPLVVDTGLVVVLDVARLPVLRRLVAAEDHAEGAGKVHEKSHAKRVAHLPGTMSTNPAMTL